MSFEVKDSGFREEYTSGMVRDTQEGKTNFALIRDGVMFARWAAHMTKGAVKYGKRNWTLACSETEMERFKESAARHFEQWLNGETDEDHAAAVYFNLNAFETTKAGLNTDSDIPQGNFSVGEAVGYIPLTYTPPKGCGDCSECPCAPGSICES